MSEQLLNYEVFERNPSENSLQNDGVSKVSNGAALRYELATFVCDGAYENGLHRILETYLNQLSLPTQPSAWVSGFYGSGKSHLVKILEALWTNRPLEDGQHPRDIARLPTDIQTQLRELSIEAKRAGGLWSASGMLSESGNQSVRMLILGIVYKAAGLSSNYGRSRFRLWVRERGWEEEITRRILEKGRDPEIEFEQYLVSPEIADAVWELSGVQSMDADTTQERWEAQFDRDDVSIDEMESALRQVLRTQSVDGQRIPLTLIVLDEAQQYIREYGDRAQALQEVVEKIQTAFESKVLVVATGQAALNSSANLQKLQGRFTVNVMLSDQDVEQVVREVVLRKNATHTLDLAAMIRQVEGEIDRHLQSTKIGPKSEDKAILVADYPLLPTRSRFWANLLHRLDPTGTSGQLRTQLRVVHGATVHVAERPLGHVIPADFIYDQLHGGLQQSGALPREVSNLIAAQDDGTADGKLRSRLIQLIFLIERLPVGDINDIGLKATAGNLADLLVEDLTQGSDDLRRQVPQLLHGLEEDGKLLRGSDGSYAIQTGESLKWQQQLQQERQALLANPGPLGELRSQTIERIVRAQAKPDRLTDGATRTPRSLRFHFGNDTPQVATGDSQVIVWVRDGWSSAPTTIVQDARKAGDEDSIVYVFIPQRGQDDLQATLANFEAAKRTLDLRGANQDTSEGQQAADSVRNRLQEYERRLGSLLEEAVHDARIYLGGGSEVDGGTLKEKMQTAFDSSLKRLFPAFTIGDHVEWSKVYSRAIQGNSKPLEPIDHHGDIGSHQVISAVRKQIPGGAGITWGAVRKTFESAPYGWPRDTVDGAVAVLVNVGPVDALRDGRKIPGKELSKPQANNILLSADEISLSMQERLQAKRPFVSLDGMQPSDEQVRAGAGALVERLVALAKRAGGEPPLPVSQIPPYLTELQLQVGSQLVRSLAVRADQLEADIKIWRSKEAEIEQRLGPWQLAEQMARHAETLDGSAEIRAKLDAIRDHRLLLDQPDPLPPVAAAYADALRAGLIARWEAYNRHLEAGLSALKASDEWVRLRESQQDPILANPLLRLAPKPATSSQSDLVKSLNTRSLRQWDADIDALPKRLNDANLAVAQMLRPEVVEVSLEKPLMESQVDVKRWIESTQTALMVHINDGRAVKIK